MEICREKSRNSLRCSLHWSDYSITKTQKWKHKTTNSTGMWDFCLEVSDNTKLRIQWVRGEMKNNRGRQIRSRESEGKTGRLGKILEITATLMLLKIKNVAFDAALCESLLRCCIVWRRWKDSILRWSGCDVIAGLFNMLHYWQFLSF